MSIKYKYLVLTLFTRFSKYSTYEHILEALICLFYHSRISIFNIYLMYICYAEIAQRRKSATKIATFCQVGHLSVLVKHDNIVVPPQLAWEAF